MPLFLAPESSCSQIHNGHRTRNWGAEKFNWGVEKFDVFPVAGEVVKKDTAE